MAGPAVPEGGWTLEAAMVHLHGEIAALREHMTTLWERHTEEMRAAERAMAIAWEASEKAIGKSEAATEKRFDDLAAYREDITAQISGLISREEFGLQHANLVDRVEALTDRMNRAEGRGLGLNAGWLYLLGGLSALGTVITIVTLLAHIAG